MTRLLEKAFKEAARLPVVEQNALAKWVLAELHSEMKWQRMFADSEDILVKLADEAIEGKTCRQAGNAGLAVVSGCY